MLMDGFEEPVNMAGRRGEEELLSTPHVGSRLKSHCSLRYEREQIKEPSHTGEGGTKINKKCAHTGHVTSFSLFFSRTLFCVWQ